MNTQPTWGETAMAAAMQGWRAWTSPVANAWSVRDPDGHDWAVPAMQDGWQLRQPATERAIAGQDAVNVVMLAGIGLPITQELQP